ncbi:PGRS family protein [Sorangium cellulosum]|uniref:PGRS family protein n=1 Tax=Sorangium cellulosum TaxID=56 RepID=A0A4P2Q621_SORCE|nr:PGRS family protein [Sorangium cellulosum]AUX24894.1 PGRS family protein [Sorangium cellulosum]
MSGMLNRILAAALLASMAVGVTGVACFDPAGNCVLTYRCLQGTSSGSAGGGGGTSDECIPSERSDAVGDECGVFVSSSLGDDTGAGAKATPMKTLAAAIERIRGENAPVRIYACAEELAEAVELPAGVNLYGGLDCKRGWAWTGDAKTTIFAGPDQVALAVRGAEGTTHIEDVLVKAADAQTEGASSIAVLVDGATVELVRSELVAGNGADGAPGAPGAEPVAPADPVPPAQAGAAGNGGVNACSDLDETPGPDAILIGGAAVENACDGENSAGGKGGDGGITNGSDGEAGVMGTAGQAGIGQPETGGAWECLPGSGLGNPGSRGEDGGSGTGASGMGTLSATSGYVGVSGGAGTAGKPGQGGGGGGGAKGLANCGGGQPGAGASGGSGGAGGCGGKPGQGGGAGGASIALASVDATVTLTDCRLQAGRGGKGGAGGAAQLGGTGGNGGTGGTASGFSQNACNGGQGGKGGNGGPGGGGLGGPSFAIAFRGAPVAQVGNIELTPGTPGEGGPGGNDNIAQNAGATGAAAPEQELQ